MMNLIDEDSNYVCIIDRSNMWLLKKTQTFK